MSDYALPIGQNPDLQRRKINAILALIVGRLDTAEGIVRRGAGDPESAVTAPVGTMWLRSDGGVGSTLYVKEVGAGSTGWAAK